MILIAKIELSDYYLHFSLTIGFIQHDLVLHSRGLTNITLAYLRSTTGNF